ncbi:MAG: hypothetical protein DI585_01740 [Pseudomonas fluorescens]|nr:MAG: hypothetical protein DI585_01740 [Pseudomonas fluorescens]
MGCCGRGIGDLLFQIRKCSFIGGDSVLQRGDACVGTACGERGFQLFEACLIEGQLLAGGDIVLLEFIQLGGSVGHPRQKGFVGACLGLLLGNG